MSREKEIVIKLMPPEAKPGWPCPRCNGQGTMGDGSASWTPTEYRYQPPSKCSLCKGSGRVACTSIGGEDT